MADYTDAGVAEVVEASKVAIRAELKAAIDAAVKQQHEAQPAAVVDEEALAVRVADKVLAALRESGELSASGEAQLPANVLRHSFDGTEIVVPFKDTDGKLIGSDVIALNPNNRSFKRRFRPAD